MGNLRTHATSLWALLVKLLVWMPWNPIHDKSTSVQVMAWCHEATSHYLSQCLPRFISPYGITRSQCVKHKNHQISHPLRQAVVSPISIVNSLAPVRFEWVFFFVWRRHDNMPPCTGSQLNTTYTWIAPWMPVANRTGHPIILGGDPRISGDTPRCPLL